MRRWARQASGYSRQAASSAIVVSGRAEDRAIAGVSHLMEYMAFKATQSRTHFRLVREVRL